MACVSFKDMLDSKHTILLCNRISNRHQLQIAKYLRHQLEDVLVKYGVDVVASGHVHAYSRSCPVIGKHCVPFEEGSVLHVITGSGGRKLSSVASHQPHWVDSAQHTWGYSRFTVHYLHLQSISCSHFYAKYLTMT
jgi:hypothetical protein